MKILLAVLFIVFAASWLAQASPIPGTGSSLVARPDKGYFLHARGFRFISPPGWRVERTPGSEDDEANLALEYFPVSNSSARFNLVTDELPAKTSLEAYTKKWLKDYGNFGFDMMAAKSFGEGDHKGIVVDFQKTTKKVQLRQVIFVKEKTAVILTCTDNIGNFARSAETCDWLAQSFHWL